MKLRQIINKINYVYSYDQGISKGFPNFYSLKFEFIFVRTIQIILSLPLSLFLGTFFWLTSYRQKTTLIILRQYRPAFASHYISMVEPLQRMMRHSTFDSTRFVLLNPGESFNSILEKENDDLFWKHLDDRSPYLRFIFFLIPNFFVERQKITASYFIYAKEWNLPPKRIVGPTPKTFLRMGLAPHNFVCFGHPSHRYYNSRFKEGVSDFSRFTDLSTYEAPFGAIQKLGLNMVRVGIDTDDLPESLSHFPIFDFSRYQRNESDELWLYSNCLFFLSIASNGGWWFAKKFGRPSLVTDGYQFLDGHLATFQTQKILWDTDLECALSFREQLMLGDTGLISELMQKNLRHVPNPSELIIEAVKEVFNFANFGHKYSDDEKILLRKWDSLTAEIGMPQRQVEWTRPSIAFLKTYQNLL